MELLKCKACGCYSMVPMEVSVMQDSESLFGEQESRFYTCHVCGDNWLSVKQTEADGTCQITFVHQMGMEPELKRIAHMQTPVVLNENTVDSWEYYVGEEAVDEEAWREKLKERRMILKSVCCN